MPTKSFGGLVLWFVIGTLLCLPREGILQTQRLPLKGFLSLSEQTLDLGLFDILELLRFGGLSE